MSETPNPKVNRYLDDPAFDHMDHALGRPSWPMRESYWNYFATEVGGKDAAAFEASPHWKLSGTDGRMAYYHVTEAGRVALAAYLSRHDQHRVFAVTFEGYTTLISAKSRSKARYSHFLTISESWPDLTFGRFARMSSVGKAT